jgi:hypothetical protein
LSPTINTAELSIMHFDGSLQKTIYMIRVESRVSIGDRIYIAHVSCDQGDAVVAGCVYAKELGMIFRQRSPGSR